MTFDFTPEQHEFLGRVRETVARLVAPAAAEIDRLGEIPTALLREVAAITEAAGPGVYRHRTGSAVLAAAVIVELAMGSAAVGAHIGLGATGSIADLPGLRGTGAPQAASDHHRLAMAAVAIGIGRAAVADAVTRMKAAGVRPGEDQQTPHWAVADAATGIESAWLLVLAAAQALDRGETAAPLVGRARFMAADAAESAVSAALRVGGPTAYHRGATLERLSRDARTVLLSLGTPESDREASASGILPL